MQVDKIFKDSETAIDSRVQTFVLCAIGAALAAGPMGFELGVYGQLFFHRIYTSWFLVTAVLISLAVGLVVTLMTKLCIRLEIRRKTPLLGKVCQIKNCGRNHV